MGFESEPATAIRSLLELRMTRYAYRQLEETTLRMFDLTEAERRVAHCLLTGMTYEQIAVLVRLSRSTIKSYARSIFTKASVEGRSEFEQLVHRLVESL